MKGANVLRIAREEWRLWWRSRLALAAGGFTLLMILVSVAATAARIDADRHAREGVLHAAETAFKEQPARHPHRMVHYGHYVSRAPSPLAVLDPGVDPYTGTVMFLEGHKQNSATFSPFYSDAKAGPFARLTPALVYQLFVPLLLVTIGFASLAREREARTLRMLVMSSATPAEIWFGKCIALAVVAALSLIPFALTAAYAVVAGESLLMGLLFLLGYLCYLLCWVVLTNAASAWSSHPDRALFLLLSLWLLLSVLAPRMVVSAAEALAPIESRVETDLAVAEALREVGDGHNANDPAFDRLRARLLAEHGAERLEDLPINFRGVVAQNAEAELTEIMNRFAERRMQEERAQSSVLAWLSPLSPQLAISAFSTRTAGSDLTHYHRFLSEAERVRYEFVQGLNAVHAEGLSYSVDMSRNSSPEASRRARVSADNWSVLSDFVFRPDSAGQRASRSAPFLLALLLWMALASAAGWLGLRRTARYADV